jgi:hypothetical protein
MKYSLTIFQSIFDNKTHRSMEFDSWDKMEDLFYSLSTQQGYKPKRGEHKQGSPLISPAVFKNNDLRRNVNVIEWGGWCAMDVDDYDSTFEEAVNTFKSNRFICYSSASSTEEHPKFRIIFPLTKTIPADKIKHFWYALNKQFNSLGDPQTKDLSRMYYVPAKYPDSYQFIFSHKDAPFLDPDELMKKHTFADSTSGNTLLDKLPSAFQQKFISMQREKLTNRGFSWNSYTDCPFINRNLVAEYQSIQETGWYSKMYAIMLSIASSAIKKGYPITPKEISELCHSIDNDTGGWYKNRPLEVEASRAIQYAFKSSYK